MEQAQQFQKVRKVTKDIQTEMGFVKDHDYCYDSSELLALRPYIADFEDFAFDIRDIDMIPQGENYALGIQRYY